MTSSPGEKDPATALTDYHALGVRTFINAAGTYTRLGGSRMPPPVVAAMAEAARHFVEVDELQVRVGDRLATLTRNEGAYVTCGAAAGLVIATAACMVGSDPALAWQLPDVRGLRRQVVMYRAHRNPYDFAVRTLPVELVEIGFPNDIAPAQGWELAHAIGEQTAAILYVASGWTPPGALPLADVVAIAHRRGVPVVVDAAAQLPPRGNLWLFTEMGADLVIFSGGKDLRGPQSSGLIVGRRELIDGCRLVGAPHHGIGRPFKVGKEEMMGLLAAVEWYLARDDAARLRWAEALIATLHDRLAGPHLCVQRSYPNEAGQPFPRAHVQFCPPLTPEATERRDRAVQLLRSGEPSIEVALAGSDGIYVNPVTVDVEEGDILVDRLCTVLAPVSAEGL